MAERRMFAKTIVESDAFLDMPFAAQALYLHMTMQADDWGFINNPRSIRRMVGASEDDLNLLVDKKFIIMFDSGVAVIKHWWVNNWIRSDRRHQTKYQEEFSLLYFDENNSYTLSNTGLSAADSFSSGDDNSDAVDDDNQVVDNPRQDDNQMPTDCQPSDNQMPDMCQPDDNQVTTTCQTDDNQVVDNPRLRLGKVRLGEDRDSSRVETQPNPGVCLARAGADGRAQEPPEHTHGAPSMPSTSENVKKPLFTTVEPPPSEPDSGPQEKLRSSRFKPPEPDDVDAYISEFMARKRLRFTTETVTGERFCDWYASKGWKVGRNGMKDWRAAVRTWLLRCTEPVATSADAATADALDFAASL